MRKKHHVDHLGIHPQKHSANQEGPQLYYVGLLVPVGRITTAQMRGVADLAERYGNGDVRLTTGQNLVIADVPEARIGALSDELLFQELPFDPSPIMRGLVACTGIDYCGLALIETKGYAIQVARELERRTAGRKVLPLTITGPAARPAAACTRWRRSACRAAAPASTARWSTPPTCTSTARPARSRRGHRPDV